MFTMFGSARGESLTLVVRYDSCCPSEVWTAVILTLMLALFVTWIFLPSSKENEAKIGCKKTGTGKANGKVQTKKSVASNTDAKAPSFAPSCARDPDEVKPKEASGVWCHGCGQKFRIDPETFQCCTSEVKGRIRKTRVKHNPATG